MISEAEMESSPPPQPPGAVMHCFELLDRVAPFRPSSRWVAFLIKANEKDAADENVNCEGSTFPISPLRDVESLKVGSLSDTLILLFSEYVDFKRGESENLEQQLDLF